MLLRKTEKKFDPIQSTHKRLTCANIFTRKSNIWHTHEKTIYAAVSQHIGPGQQKQLRIGTAQLTHANLAGQVNGQQSDKFGKAQQKNNGMPSSKSD